MPDEAAKLHQSNTAYTHRSYCSWDTLQRTHHFKLIYAFCCCLGYIQDCASEAQRFVPRNSCFISCECTGTNMAPTPISPPASTSILFTSFIIGLWYSSNIGVLLLNKYLLSNKDASFHYPILLTFCHMAASFLIGGVVALTNVLPFKAIKSRVQGVKVKLHVWRGQHTLSLGKEEGQGSVCLGLHISTPAWATDRKALLLGTANGACPQSLVKLVCCTSGDDSCMSRKYCPYATSFRWSSWLASFA